MPEQNEPTTSPPQPKEICSIRIVFPVMSDEQAIDYKKRLSDILADIPDAHIDFSLRPLPKGIPQNARTLDQLRG